MAPALVGLGSPRLAAVILAGGQSSRMGTDKAGLIVDNTPLLARVAGAVAETVEGPIVVVGSAARNCRILASAPALHDSRRFWDYLCIDDAPDGAGPVDALRVGIAALIGRFPSIEHVIISPCDLPRITADGFASLVDVNARSTIDVEQNLFDETTPRATVVRVDGRPQWLSAILHRPMIDKMIGNHAARSRRVVDIFADVAITWFDDVERRFVDADTPIDLREARAEVRESPSTQTSSETAATEPTSALADAS